MARSGAVGLTETTLKILVFSLITRHVSSQSCTDPLPQTCTCNQQLFSCISANLTAFPTSLPNGETLQIIDLSNNTITSVDIDVLSPYTQLQTLTLVGNGLTRIAKQTLSPAFTEINLSSNPIVCDDSLAWLRAVTRVIGTCASGQDVSAYLDGLKPTPTVAVTGSSAPTELSNTTDGPSSQPKSTSSTNMTTQALEPNRLYVLAIIIPILVIVVIIIAIVVFSVKKNRKQQESYNSAIRYSVVRKDAGAPSNRVYSDVTTEL